MSVEVIDAQSAFLRCEAEVLGATGQIARGLVSVEAGLAYAEQHQELWCVADLHRTKGELLLLQASPGARERAERQFLKAIEVAREQGALAWELRAAMSLARLWQTDSVRARAVLAPVFDRFSEGFGTADLRAAKVLLDVRD